MYAARCGSKGAAPTSAARAQSTDRSRVARAYLWAETAEAPIFETFYMCFEGI